ncbi:MAG: hypothetical protein ACHREM_30800, partial [Polyangiales bacterium]
QRLDLAPDLGRLTSRLHTVWDDHLGFEEGIVFPALDLWLSPEQRSSLLASMRARRSDRALAPSMSRRR